jgi:uncharacterized membrane protein
MRFESETTIARPADDVWSYAADIARHPDWMTVTDATVVRGDGTTVGSRGREPIAAGPFRWDVEFEVTEANPGRRLVWRSTSGAPLSLTVDLELESIDGSTTRAVYGASVRMHGLWRLLSPLIAMEGKAGPARELQRLKANVEATAPQAVASSPEAARAAQAST